MGDWTTRWHYCSTDGVSGGFFLCFFVVFFCFLSTRSGQKPPGLPQVQAFQAWAPESPASLGKGSLLPAGSELMWVPSCAPSPEEGTTLPPVMPGPRDPECPQHHPRPEKLLGEPTGRTPAPGGRLLTGQHGAQGLGGCRPHGLLCHRLDHSHVQVSIPRR